MTDLPNYQSPLQQEQHQHYLGQLDNNQPVMDELLLEQIFSLPAWSDVGGGLGKVPLDYHASGSEANPGLELSGAHKLYTMSLLPSVLPPGAFSEQGLGSQEREKEEIVENLHLRGSTQYCNGDRDFVSRIQRQHEIQVSKHSPVGRPVGSLSFNDSRTLNLVSRTIGSSQGGSGVHPVSPLPPLRLMNSGTGSLLFRSSSSMVSNGSPLPVLTPGSSNLQSPAMLSHSPSGRSSGSEGSAGARDCQSPPPLAPTFHQSYVGGTSPLPFALGQSKTETLLVTGEVSSGEAQFLGKRSRNEEALLKEPISNQGRDGLFNTLAGGQVGLPHLGRTNGQPLSQENLPAIQGVVSPSYGNGAAAAQAQSSGQAVPATAIINGVRPRVRARRGQATDPHSIAERLRRERIAERMKSLQELVPNSNKTDKASMLDEIIDYVKFLQLQVKVLSMSRLGGAGAVAQVIADLPSEGPSNLLAATLGRSSGASGTSPDGIALTEHQVARLMEEDMGTAMQYLQSKGLCLMPISLASAISSTGARSNGINQGVLGVTCDDKERSQAHAVAYSMSNGLAMAGRTGSFTGGVGGDGRINDIDSVTKAGSDGIRQANLGGTEVNLEEKAHAFEDAKDSKLPKNGFKSTEEIQRQSQQ